MVFVILTTWRKHSACCRLATGNSRGAILPLLLLLLVPILGLLALVVDLGVILNSNRDLEQKTRNASLSALSAFQDQYRYLSTQPIGERGCEYCNLFGVNCVPRCSMEAASKRANEVAFTNMSLGERFSRDPSSPIDEFAPKNSSATSTIPDESEFRMGVYYWFPPSECGQELHPSCDAEYPFFRTVDLNDNAELANANAVELRATFPASNPITAIFANILGTKEFRVHATGRAAILPRNDMFLIDLSRSMYRSNYLKDKYQVGDPVREIDGSRAEFGYLTADGASGLNCPVNTTLSATSACCADFCASKPSLCSTCTAQACGDTGGTFSNGYIESGDGYSQDRTRWNELDLAQPFPDNELPVQMQHFQSEYKCVSVISNWSDSGQSRRNYLIDFANAANNSTMSARPEPLFSVLEATNSALVSLQNRNMSVDRIGIIAFDDKENNRETFNPRILLPSPPGNLQIASWERATNRTYFGSPSYGFLSKSLFPLAGSMSDIFQPLREAAYLISLEPSYRIAKNTINIFTDGLQNCVYDELPSGEWWSGWERRGICENYGTNIVEGIRNLTDPDFVDELKRRQISVNMILFGEEVRPHKLVRKNAAGNGCRDQIEDNASGAPAGAFVNSNWEYYEDLLDGPSPDPSQLDLEFSNKSGASPFTAPNHLYEGLVAPTKGLWLPVMPPYEVPGATGPVPVQFWGKMQHECATAEDTDPLQNLILRVKDPTDPTGVREIDIEVTDGAGRLLYDPLGESVAGQMRRFVDQIIQSPYVLVP